MAPGLVAGPSFGWLWDSEPLDAEHVGRFASYPPRIYGSPLYVDDLQITGGDHAGITASVVLVATSNAWVYAVNACARAEHPDVPAGAILWRARLGTPAIVPALDGGMLLGVLGTPYLDLDASPPRLYVATHPNQPEPKCTTKRLDRGTGTRCPR